MKFKLFATDDWLARHPKVMIAIAFVCFLIICLLEEIS